MAEGQKISFGEAVRAVQRARAWVAAARRHAGEFRFGPESGDAIVLGVFGDSIGCGLGISEAAATFAGLVAARLAEKGPVVCRIAAACGARASTLLTQPVVGDERFAAVSIGSNDVMHGVRPEAIERCLLEFLARLCRAERVVVVGPGNIAAVSVVPEALRPFARRRMLAAEVAIARAVARFPNVRHVGPSHPGMVLSAADFAADGIHPSLEGQRRIADAVYELLA